MKTILVLAAAYGLSISAAAADCAAHSASVDKKTTTASLSADKQSTDKKETKTE
ncbi:MULTISPECIES: hypothetical protein [Phyllobacteriaceae]|uniref:hypothetical protein n=1 Tax=Phyllobacteriaceae TaxID=69277 RepID=UPI00160AD06D|nr:hypothetical protein [Mesorhizobium sp. RMAD-H1]MBB2970924.1 hypothetical protein [Mesorhizobium sp. RMAD-H1]